MVFPEGCVLARLRIPTGDDGSDGGYAGCLLHRGLAPHSAWLTIDS